MPVGLRIDVDTFKGTQDGVPKLLSILAKHNIAASFFFSVGPDNMGRHLWRLLRPAFLKKMLRSKAASLYGWDIIFRGTLWPGTRIGEKAAGAIRNASAQGHEIGLHAWDHHAWQARIDKMGSRELDCAIRSGYDRLTQITGKPPTCSAAPGWKSNNAVLLKKNEFPFRFNSDCRGESIFCPIVNGKTLFQPQIPTTLPTYDEVIGGKGISNDTYNEFLLSLIKPDKLNVLTIHAEVEGMALSFLFEQFLKIARDKGIYFGPLGDLINESVNIETGVVVAGEIPGREGWVALQAPAR